LVSFWPAARIRATTILIDFFEPGLHNFKESANTGFGIDQT
jgi:hypothetical protein